jgi:succinate dehydrogenase / fumarate reductase iron-sulfur subunit
VTATLEAPKSGRLTGKVTVTLRVKRYNPETDTKPHWDTFTVEIDAKDRVLDALHLAKWHQDGTLTFRRSCAHAVCGSDAMVINGKNDLACRLLIENVGTDITLEPIRGLPVIKDLVVDMEPFFAQYRAVLPYLINGQDPGYKERYQSSEDRERCAPSASCAPAAPPAARSTGATRPTWDRRPSSTPTGSSSTPATRRPASGWRS